VRVATAADSAEYHKYGGPLIDPNQLKLLFRLTFVSSFLQNFQYIQTEILKDMPSKAEWNSISDRWDPAVMGKWNVRLTTRTPRTQAGSVQLLVVWSWS
jgi:hypothetical protein